jgi:hypothetical protein
MANNDLVNKRIVSKLEKAKQLTESGSNVFSKKRLVSSEKEILKETKYLGLTDYDIRQVLELPSLGDKPSITEALHKALRVFEKDSIYDKEFLRTFYNEIKITEESMKKYKEQQLRLFEKIFQSELEESMEKYKEQQLLIFERLESIQGLYNKALTSESTPLSSKASLSYAVALASMAITSNILSANLEILEKRRSKPIGGFKP